MNAHDEKHDSLTERSLPRTRACAGADLDLDLDLNPLGTKVAVNPSSVPRCETFTALPNSEFRVPSNIDPETGELLEHACPNCNNLAAKVAGLETDLDATQDKLTQALSQIKALKTQDENRRARHRLRPRIEAIFADWQTVCGKERSKLTSDRHDAIAAAVNLGYDEQVFHLASLGARYNNPWKSRNGGLMTEIATFCKGSWIEQFANAGAQWQAQAPRLSLVPSAQMTVLDRVLERLPAGWRSLEDGVMSTCPCCAGNLFVRSMVRPSGELVLMDCYGVPACDRAEVVLALGLNAGDMVETVRVLNEFPARFVLSEHLAGAMRQMLTVGVVERAA
jgi:hypothetical protein